MKASGVLCFSFILSAVAAQASAVYSYSFAGTAGSDSESATAQGLGIIGLSFDIGSFTTPGTLATTGGVTEVSSGSGGDVTAVDFSTNPVTTSTTNLAPNWGLSYINSATGGCKASDAFCLNGHSSGGQPFDMIIGTGPYTSFNNGVKNFDPYLAGPVDFEIDNFPNVTFNTTFSDVQMDFGTNPDGSLGPSDLNAVCTGTNCPGSATPEPASITLTAGGLLALAWWRRSVAAGPGAL